MGGGDQAIVATGDGRGEEGRQRIDSEGLPVTWPLIGRADELAHLAEAVRGGSRSAVIAGGAGVGKSRLLAAFLEGAGRGGARTVLVRATRSTATIPFGPFAPWTPEPVGLATTDRLQVLRATTRGVIGDGDGRTVVAVDDAHLLDEGSAALVMHLATQTAATVVVVVRTGEPAPDAVIALWKEGLADRLDLQPLSEEETAQLSELVLGGRVRPAAQRRLWLLSRGTPLYLREVLHAAVSQGALAREGDAWRWEGDLTSSGRLGELLGDRLADLDAEERRVLELVAVGEPLPLDVVAVLDSHQALAAVERRGLVAVEGDSQQLVRLAHPLYGEVLRADVPRLVARGHQRALAAAAVAVGWHHHDPLRVAVWWLETDPMAAPADLLLSAARRALSLGDWALADRLARAAESAGAGPVARLIRAAALVHVGGWGQVEGLLTAAPPEGLPDEMLAEHARLRAGFLSWSRKGRPGAGREALVDVAMRLSPPERSRALAEAAYIALTAGDLPEAGRLARDAMNDAGRSAHLRVRAMAVAALASMLQGQPSVTLWLATTAAPFVDAALAADPYPDNPAGIIGAAHCLALVLDGRVDAAWDRAEADLGQLEQHDVEARRSSCAAVAGHIALLQGRLAAAERWAGRALTSTGPGPSGQWPAAILATAAAQRGHVATAEKALGHAAATVPAIPLYAHVLTLAQCWVRAARDDLSAARTLAARAADDAADSGMRLFEMLALLDLARLGSPEASAARLVELARRIEGPYAASAAAFACASLAGDADALDDVSARFEAMGARLLAAEAAARAAALRRSAGRREGVLRSLARARTLRAQCDGARTPDLHDVDALPEVATLTRREREVVELAAQGLTNREIAARLYVSVRTVNAHLGHAYAKLGTNDRHDLVALAPPPTAGH